MATATDLNATMFRTAIENTKGRFFTVLFQKADGTMRKMTARVGVNKHKKGLFTGNDKAPSKDRGLITVWDSVAQEYRSIRLTRVHEVRCGDKRVVRAIPTLAA